MTHARRVQKKARRMSSFSPLMSSACGLQLPARMLSFGLLVALALSIITGPSIASAERLLPTRLRHEAAFKNAACPLKAGRPVTVGLTSIEELHSVCESA